MHPVKAILRLLGLKPSNATVLADMRRDWDSRAKKDAQHYVATLRDDWTDAEFFESGRIWLQYFVLPDLALICGERNASDMRILEIGCGAGRMTRGLSEIFGAVDAVDVSPEMVSRAKAALVDRPNVHLHVNDGMSLKMFGANEFDFAFSAIVFQHIPRKRVIENYVREVARVLSPGCVFKFQVQGVSIAESEADTWVGVGFTEDEMRTLAGKCGFTVHAATGSGTQDFWLTFIRNY